MAFVIEEKTEAEREAYPIGDKWLIDHERGAYFFLESGLPEVLFYELHWKGGVARASVDESIVRKENQSVNDVTHTVLTLKVSQKLASEIDAVKQLIGEALVAWGWNINPSKTGMVTVQNLDRADIMRYPRESTLNPQR